MIANKECYERGCACYDSRVDGKGIKVVAEREWVGLTEEELYEIFDDSDDGSSPCGVCGACSKCKIEVAIARATEAKLKEKNSDHRN